LQPVAKMKVVVAQPKKTYLPKLREVEKK